MSESVRRQINDVLRSVVVFAVCFPLIVFLIWGINFGAKRFFGGELSLFWNSIISVAGTSAILAIGPKNPGRAAVAAAAVGYLLMALAIWLFD